ncbi:hypothetical protein HDU83_005359 [Entophlyctis luteolus]|nr:hypothetical protein HDU83_005359 [Entophlyctis luteolus]
MSAAHIRRVSVRVDCGRSLIPPSPTARRRYPPSLQVLSSILHALPALVHPADLRSCCRRIQKLRSTKRLLHRDELVAAVQRHFNEQTITEKEAIPNFIYALRNQGVLWKANLANRDTKEGKSKNDVKAGGLNDMKVEPDDGPPDNNNASAADDGGA